MAGGAKNSSLGPHKNTGNCGGFGFYLGIYE